MYWNEMYSMFDIKKYIEIISYKRFNFTEDTLLEWFKDIGISTRPKYYVTERTKEKNRKATLELWKNNRDEMLDNLKKRDLSKLHSKEFRDLQRKITIERWESEDSPYDDNFRKRLSKSLKGIKPTEEQKIKMSKSSTKVISINEFNKLRESGLTMPQIAEKLNVSQSSIYRQINNTLLWQNEGN